MSLTNLGARDLTFVLSSGCRQVSARMCSPASRGQLLIRLLTHTIQHGRALVIHRKWCSKNCTMRALSSGISR
jgi:Tfp pilus assembly protein PilV